MCVCERERERERAILGDGLWDGEAYGEVGRVDEIGKGGGHWAGEKVSGSVAWSAVCGA